MTEDEREELIADILICVVDSISFEEMQARIWNKMTPEFQRILIDRKNAASA